MRKKVIKWVSWNDIENNPYNPGMFKNSNGYWEIEDFTENYEEAIIKNIIDNNFLICGDTHQEKCIPIFENNEYILLSMRKWGELMVEIEKSRNPDKCHSYIDYYMACICNEMERLPYEE